jgi:hypothetical protein
VPTEVVAALIAGVVAIAGVVLGPSLKARHDRTREAEALLRRYREPLLYAAYELQSRLWNIVSGKFLEAYWTTEPSERKRYAETSTLWLVGQYLGWAEALRRDVQYLDLGKVERSRELRHLLSAIAFVWASDTQVDDDCFLLYRSEQRAIGELMLAGGEGERVDCLGYVAFEKELDDAEFARWFARLRNDLDAVARKGESYRVRLLQRRLMELVDFLDPGYVNFPNRRERTMVELGKRRDVASPEDRRAQNG